MENPIDLERIGACPACRGELLPRAGAFACRSCGASWPVVGGIPRFVDSQQYVGSFGWEWQRHHHTQIDSARRAESEATFAEKTGLTPADVKGKLVLDVGVGTGRFADVVARWGGFPVGVDLSHAVVSARRNLDPYYPNALVTQADLFKLPFKEESFDIVYSIGVLHHTPSTREAFRTIARFAKPGAAVAIGIYEDQGNNFFRYSTRYRAYTSEMSHSLLHLLSHLSIPRHHVVNALRTLCPPASDQFHQMFPMRIHEDPQWRVLDTFDWYSPHFQWLHHEDEVVRWFEDLGFTGVARFPERTMVSVRGTRPSKLATPPPSEEKRIGALTPLPSWVPARGWARDAALLLLLAREVFRVILEQVGVFARAPFTILRIACISTITAFVIAAKHMLGIKGDLMRRSSRAT